MNNVELLETALSDSEGEEFEIEVEYTVEFRSPFTVIFEDDEFRAKWDPFIDITEEEEANLLALLASREAFRKEKLKCMLPFLDSLSFSSSSFPVRDYS
jgi:hypothetical protein